jgi:hypothetical protein
MDKNHPAQASNITQSTFEARDQQQKNRTREDLFDNAIRKEILRNHPLFGEAIVLETLPIRSIQVIAKRIIFLRGSGVCFGAGSGAGKTKAMFAIRNYVTREFPEVAIYLHDTQNRQMPSIRAFFQHFLDSVDHAEDKGETYQLRKRLRNRLVDDARRGGMNLVLLLIDESQAMDVEDFKFLKDISNALSKQNVKLVTILTGQEPNFGTLRRNMINERNLDLVGRFLMRMIKFPAYSTFADIESILKCIDNQIYPADSNWTEFFYPLAWGSGFRLQSEAQRLFDALEHVTSGKKTARVFPVRQVFEAIHAFILDYAGYDSIDLKLPNDAWIKVVRDAQFALAVNLSNMTNGGENKVVQT